MNTVFMKNRDTIPLGKRGENLVLRVMFPMLSGMDGAVLLHKRPGDEHPYAAQTSVVTENGKDYVEWIIGLADTSVPGIGEAELIFTKNDAVAKSITYTTKTSDSIDDGETIIPTAAESWVQYVAELTASAQYAESGAEAAAKDAAQSARDAIGLANEAQESAEDARTYAQAADTAKSEAQAARNAAQTAERNAANSAETAQGYTVSIEEAVSRAESARDAAGESASDADASAIQAALNATSAQAAKSQAVSAARNAAVSADSAAGSAASAQTSASNAQTSAESAQTSAQESQTAAEQARVDVSEETNARTIADAALKRSLDMLWKLNKGISYVFETDAAEAYSKSVPSGAVVGDIKSIGGHSEVVDGEIISADVESVDLIGRNLLDVSVVEHPKGITTYDSYVFTGSMTGDFRITIFLDEAEIQPSYEGSAVCEAVVNGSSVYLTKTAQSKRIQGEITSIRVFASNSYSRFFGKVKLMLEETSNAVMKYYPKITATLQIKQAIRELPFYGFSNNMAHNYIDFERKKYVQTVTAVVFDGNRVKFNGKWNGAVGKSAYHLQASSFGAASKKQFYGAKSEMLTGTDLTFASAPIWSIGCGNGVETTVTVVLPSEIETIEQANAWVAANPQTVIFELAEPIETDISEYLDDDFSFIEVEDISKIVFSNSGRNLPIPSSIDYIVKVEDAT